jgi:hypothetical protein
VTALSTSTAKNDIAVAVLGYIEAQTPSQAASISADAPALEAVIRSTIASAPVRSLLRTDVTEIYSDLKNRVPGTINLQPLVQQFLTPLHAANANISATPATYATSYLWHIRRPPGGGNFTGLGRWGWILTLIGLLGVILVTRFLLRHRWVKMLGLFLTVGIPGIFLALIGASAAKRASNIHVNSSDNPIYVAVLKGVLRRAGTVLEGQGLILIVIAAALMLIWSGIWMITGRRTGGAQPATS